MIRQSSLIAVAVAFICGCSKADHPAMHSFWTVVSAEEGGQPADPRKKSDVFIDSEILVNGMGTVDFRWTDPPGHKMKLDSSKTPKQIDLTHFKADLPAWPGIYELNGDDLKICLDLEGKNRPTEFKTKAGDKCLYLVLKRKRL